ncbi:hypothetical protein [Fimbriiglobus ruber]|uniref:Uncharacterized protein n=1 Tax=Fimbriiglobus ruber TaxID=1908690 RepID=A0A225DQK8_9BACT|nr:hypothetical protein [Fimbriiglobus ruber]OWK38457.1 hypothetical protein FRUB_07577 [Fimbriiglobus ruber]
MTTTWMAHAGLATIAVAAASATGCDAPPRGAVTETATTEARPPSPLAATNQTAPISRPAAPKPDITLMAYDPVNRTLTLYELPDRSSRWMLATTSVPTGVPVEREHQFPQDMDLDLDQTTVFYTVPNNRPSPAVPIREILEAGGQRAFLP